jgi:hypothetical protein
MDSPNSDPKPAVPKTFWLEFAVLFIITVAAFFVRTAGLTGPLWLDELHTSWVVADGLTDIPARATAGNQHPLYFYLVWGVTQVCGHTEWSIRLLSLLSGVGCVAMVYGLVRKLTGNPSSDWRSVYGSIAVAAAASLLLALERRHIVYSLEGRAYALVSLVAVAQAYAFVLCWQKWTLPRAAGFVLSSVAMFYLHYTTGVIILCEGLIWLAAIFGVWFGKTAWKGSRARATESGRKTDSMETKSASQGKWVVAWIGVWLTILIANALAIFHIKEVHARRGNWALFIKDPTWQATVELARWWPYLTVSGVAVCLLAGMLLLVTFVRRKHGEPGLLRAWLTRLIECRYLSLIAALAVLIPVVITVLKLADIAPAYHPRYALPTLVFCIATAACLPALLPNWKWQVAGAILLVISVVIVDGSFRRLARGEFVRPSREGWKEAVVAMDGQAKPSSPVLVWPGLIEARSLSTAKSSGDLAEFCTLPLRGIYQLNGEHALWALPNSHSKDTFTEFAAAFQKAAPAEVWLVVRSRSDARVTKLAAAYQKKLATIGKYEITSQVFYSGSVAVVRYEKSSL